MDHSLVSDAVMDALVVAHGVSIGDQSLDELELMVAGLSDDEQDLVFEGIQTMHKDAEFRRLIAQWRNREP